MFHLICKTFSFDAAHALIHLPPEHKCSRLHGHTYSVTLALSGELTPGFDWVLDYGEMKPFKDWIDQNLDHHFISSDKEPYLKYLRPDEVFPLGAPSTAENLSKLLYSQALRFFGLKVVYVEISETPNTKARCPG